MPEFIPEHTPHNLDAFTRGYLDAAEWLLDDGALTSTEHGNHGDA